MKKLLLSMVLAVAAPFAWAQVSETTTTTTTTEGSGTVTEYTPGSVIVLKESSGPRTYHFGKTVTYVTRSGKVLDEDAVRTRVKIGVPVHVHYVGTGDNVMVDRVILDEDKQRVKASFLGGPSCSAYRWKGEGAFCLPAPVSIFSNLQTQLLRPIGKPICDAFSARITCKVWG